MEREGYRANDGDRCAFCKAELLDVLGPLAEEHGYDAVATGTNADDARAGFRPGIAAAAERGAVTPLQGRRPDQGADPGGVAGLGAADLGQAGGGLPELAGRLRHRDHAGPAGPGRAGRGGAARGPHARPATRSATCGSATSGSRPGSRWTAALIEAARAHLDVVRGAGFEAAEVDPLGFRSGSMNERARGPRALPLNSLA